MGFAAGVFALSLYLHLRMKARSALLSGFALVICIVSGAAVALLGSLWLLGRWSGFSPTG